MTFLIISAITLALAVFVAWFFWVAVLGFVFSLIPAGAAFAWVGKLAAIAMVGWLGGVGIPLAILIFGIWLAVVLQD